MPAIDNILFKHPVVVADAVTASRQTQRRRGVKEASRRAAQTAVAKPGSFSSSISSSRSSPISASALLTSS